MSRLLDHIPPAGEAQPVDALRRALLKTGIAAAGAAALGGIPPAFGASPAPATPLRDYSVAWSPDALDALRRRLKAFRFPAPSRGRAGTTAWTPTTCAA